MAHPLNEGPSIPPDAALRLEPSPRLLQRARAELSADLDPARPLLVTRAPGRLDVMGGIADYTGALVCEMPLDRAASVLSQARTDGAVQVFSFNLLDAHQPFTLRIPVTGLATVSVEALRGELSEPGRRWAGYLLGCLAILRDEGLCDPVRDLPGGLTLAVLSTVPLGGGVSSSAAIEVATMMNLVARLGLRDRVDPMRVAAMCQRVENAVVGAPCGIMDQVTSCYGRAGALLKLKCQPHEVEGFADLPPGTRVVGINSQVKHSVGGGEYGRTRCAAFMGHAIILAKMRDMGAAAGRQLLGDPMGGYLANLDPDDYKRLFRQYLPESLRGGEFLMRFGRTIDTATTITPDTEYAVQSATDHHVLEARRVRQFVQFLAEAAAEAVGSTQYEGALNKAGHLMYASHKSYGDRANLGAAECDLLVDLVRRNEPAGLYGAKITGGGSGGTVAVLCRESPTADAAITSVLAEYQRQTGHVPQLLAGSSDGAWHTAADSVPART